MKSKLTTKLFVMSIVISIVNINSMKVPDSEDKLHQVSELAEMVESPTDEFIEAWKLATGKVASLKSIVALAIEKNNINIDNNKIPEELNIFL